MKKQNRVADGGKRGRMDLETQEGRDCERKYGLNKVLKAKWEACKALEQDSRLCIASENELS